MYKDIQARHATAQRVIEQRRAAQQQQQERAGILNQLMAAHEAKAQAITEAYKPNRLPSEGDSVLYALQVASWLKPPDVRSPAVRSPAVRPPGGLYAARAPAPTQRVEYLPLAALTAASEPGALVCAYVDGTFERAGDAAVAAAHLCELGAGGVLIPPSQPTDQAVDCDPRTLIRIHPAAYAAFPFHVGTRVQPCNDCLDAVRLQLHRLKETATPLSEVLRQRRDADSLQPSGHDYLLQNAKMDKAGIAAEGVKALEQGCDANFNSIERCLCAHGHLRPQVPLAAVAVVSEHHLRVVRRWWPATPTEAIEDLYSEEPCRRCEEELRGTRRSGSQPSRAARRRNGVQGDSSLAEMEDFLVHDGDGDGDGDSGGDGGDDPLVGGPSAVRSLAPVSKIDALLGAVSTSPACERQLNIERKGFEIFKEDFENLPGQAKQPLKPTWLVASAGEATDRADVFAVGDTGLVWVLARETRTWQLSETNFAPRASVWAHATRSSLPLALTKRWGAAVTQTFAESDSDAEEEEEEDRGVDRASGVLMNGIRGQFLFEGTFVHGVVAHGASADVVQVHVSHCLNGRDIAMSTTRLMASPLFLLPSGVHLAPPPDDALKAGIRCDARIALAEQYLLVDYGADGWWIGHVMAMMASHSIGAPKTNIRKVRMPPFPQTKPPDQTPDPVGG